MLSSLEHGTFIWYNTKTMDISFTEPEAGGDPDPSANGPEPADGGETLMRAAQRIAEEVRWPLF